VSVTLGAVPEVRDGVVVLMLDIVESVALMQTDFEEVVQRWRELVARVRAGPLRRHGGRLVKSLGDGLLLTFDAVESAVRAAFEIQALVPAINAGVVPERVIALRVAVHEARVAIDELDIYGPGVNLTARLMTLIGPGEVVLSDVARDKVADPLLCSFTDLGPCYLKHLPEPVRAFAAQPAQRQARLARPALHDAALRPRIAVLDFAVDGGDAVQRVWGAMLADELTRLLSRQSLCGVVSRLSTQALAGVPAPWEETSRALQARYLVGGRCVPGPRGARVLSTLWLQGAGAVLEDDFEVGFDELRDPDSDRINRWVGRLSQALLGTELRRVQGLSLPTLADYTLLFAGVTLMHKSSAQMVRQAGDALAQLCERHPRVAEPRAWLAKLHVLRMANGVAADAANEARQAHAHIRRALSEDPTHALALTVEGLVRLFLERDPPAARQCYEQALAANPNEALAWLFLSSVHAHAGDGAAAMQCIGEARSLSPMDPLAHFFDGFTAWALLSAQRYDEALAFAQRALAANSNHRPSYFTLTMAQQLAGDTLGARRTAAEVLALVPNFSVRAYLDAFPGGANDHARRLADALREAGLPD
jgi:adenylate cyclase